MTNNYVKLMRVKTSRVTGQVTTNDDLFFFNDKSPGSIRGAYEAAQLTCATHGGGSLSLYKRPRVAGPWDTLPLIGMSLNIVPMPVGAGSSED